MAFLADYYIPFTIIQAEKHVGANRCVRPLADTPACPVCKHTTFHSLYHAVNPIPRYILQFFFAGLCKAKAAFTSSAFTMR